MAETPSTRQLSHRSYKVTRFRLTVTVGVNRGRSSESAGLEFSVGTSRGNELMLQDSSVSRHHFTLHVGERGVMLRDLDSTNGTFVNGVQVFHCFVCHGATIQVGQTEMRFEVLGDHANEPLSSSDRLGVVTGKSHQMRRLFAIVEKVAPSDATILLEGETGTGKSLMAETLHAFSLRASAPFVVIDCAALSTTVIESELFGHEKGSFSGAERDKAGLFEQAQGGTVFLDEVGELPLEIQPRLLRVLQNKTVRRVGATQDRKIDFRAVAATNRDLRKEVNRGTMRSDLWYRLNGVRLVLPPLRERVEDLPLLVEQLCCDLGSDTLPSEVIDGFLSRSWPGNIRELRNAVERAVLFRDKAETYAMLENGEQRAVANPESFRDAKQAAIAHWEQQYVTHLYHTHGGNVSAAARDVRMDRNYLRKLCGRYELLLKE